MKILNSDVKKALLSHWGITVTRLQKMRSGVLNTNYRIISTQGEFLFKIYSFRNPPEIAFEQKLLRVLEHDQFPCPRIVSTLDKKELINFQNKSAVLFGYIPGKNKQTLTREQLFQTGKLLGRLHTKFKDIKQTVEKDRWEPEDIRGFVVSEKEQIIEKKFPHAEERIPFFVSELHKFNLPNTLPKGLTHQDVKPENVVVSGKQVSIIDFDNVYYGILLMDFMTPVIWVCFRGSVFDQKKFHQFRLGYETERPLTSLEKKSLEDALRFRLLRESFVWSMRFNSLKARKVHDMFFSRYVSLPKNLSL